MTADRNTAVVGILAAIAIPAFLNQQERASEAELLSLTRNPALEVEAAVVEAGGDYATLDDGLYDLVDRSLAAQGAPEEVVLVRNSWDTFWSRDTFSICIEDQRAPMAAVYRSDEGMLGVFPERCGRT